MRRILTLLLLGAALAAPQSQGATATGHIPGTAVHRRNGTWLGIQLTSNNFIVTFYDKTKNPMPADATTVVLSWSYPHAADTYSPTLSAELTPLTDISSVFTSSYSVPYPHRMTLRVTLTIAGSTPDAPDPFHTEVYVIRFAESPSQS
jgi:hypothetical protein